MSKYHAKISLPENRRAHDAPVYMSIIGKVEDNHDVNGMEWL